MSARQIDRQTIALIIATLIALAILAPATAGAATSPPETAPSVNWNSAETPAEQADRGYTWGEALRIAWAVARWGWAGLPDSPYIGCTRPAPAAATCWIDIQGGGQLWIRVPGR